jgi:hypothetical protein
MIKENRKLKLMVSSTVYGIEELLERIYTLLAVDYDVWMSHKGTLPVRSDRTAFENCLDAVEQCDLFLGIITSSYGSGQDPDDPTSKSITHQEILKAIELDKPRWILAHEYVVFARLLLKNLGYEGAKKREGLLLKKNSVLADLRVIDLYEDAIKDIDPPGDVPLAERRGNWVQNYHSGDDASLFICTQFFRYQEVEAFIKEQIIEGSRGRFNGGDA